MAFKHLLSFTLILSLTTSPAAESPTCEAILKTSVVSVLAQGKWKIKSAGGVLSTNGILPDSCASYSSPVTGAIDELLSKPDAARQAEKQRAFQRNLIQSALQAQYLFLLKERVRKITSTPERFSGNPYSKEFREIMQLVGFYKRRFAKSQKASGSPSVPCETERGTAEPFPDIRSQIRATFDAISNDSLENFLDEDLGTIRKSYPLLFEPTAQLTPGALMKTIGTSIGSEALAVFRSSYDPSNYNSWLEENLERIVRKVATAGFRTQLMETQSRLLQDLDREMERVCSGELDNYWTQDFFVQQAKSLYPSRAQEVGSCAQVQQARIARNEKIESYALMGLTGVTLAASCVSFGVPLVLGATVEGTLIAAAAGGVGTIAGLTSAGVSAANTYKSYQEYQSLLTQYMSELGTVDVQALDTKDQEFLGNLTRSVLDGVLAPLDAVNAMANMKRSLSLVRQSERTLADAAIDSTKSAKAPDASKPLTAAPRELPNPQPPKEAPPAEVAPREVPVVSEAPPSEEILSQADNVTPPAPKLRPPTKVRTTASPPRVTARPVGRDSRTARPIQKTQLTTAPKVESVAEKLKVNNPPQNTSRTNAPSDRGKLEATPRAAWANQNRKGLEAMANSLGYTKSTYKAHMQPVYCRKTNCITFDIDGHNGGYWKKFTLTKEGLKREGTYTIDLQRLKD